MPRSGLAGGLNASNTFQITPTKWDKLGIVLGASLTQHDRDRISSIVNEYLFWESIERSAPAAVDEAREIYRVKSEAVKFKNAIYNSVSTENANALIKISVSFSRRSKLDTVAYEKFRRSILKFIASCDDEIRNLATEPGWEVGVSWQTMINQITKYFKKRKYKTGARQDGLSSPFVNFIWYLHQYILNDADNQAYVRGQASQQSLAQAIHRARKPKI